MSDTVIPKILRIPLLAAISLFALGSPLAASAAPDRDKDDDVVLVDDTIVRGTTSRPIVQLLRNAGAKEIHMRVHAPPIMWPCYLGVDLARREDLIAAKMTVTDIGRYIGADSIGYLSLEGLMRAVGAQGNEFCVGCLTGTYPLQVDLSGDKYALEQSPTAIGRG